MPVQKPGENQGLIDLLCSVLKTDQYNKDSLSSEMSATFGRLRTSVFFLYHLALQASHPLQKSR